VKPIVRRADVRVAKHFADNLRPADARELEAAHPNLPLEEILCYAIRNSEAYVAGFGEGAEWCVLFGVEYIEPGIGTIWMVCTEGIKGRTISILREARHWITYWKHQYGLLANYVETRNYMAVAWLALLGAQFGGPEFRNGVRVRLFNL